MARRKRSDSTDAAIADVHRIMEVPPGGISLSLDEQVVWEQMVKVRAEWREMDLILLAKVVKLEVKIRAWWEMAEVDGPIVTNKRGTQIENPLLRSINTLQHQQLSIITKMSIMQVADARAVNSTAKRINAAEKIKKQSAVSLLASPAARG